MNTVRTPRKTSPIVSSVRPNADLTERYGPIFESHYRRAVAYLADGGRPTVSGIQRKLKIGYKSARFLMNVLVSRGNIKALNDSQNSYFEVDYELDITSEQYESLNQDEVSFYKEYIEDKNNSFIRSVIDEAVESVLGEHFRKLKIPDSDRKRLASDLAEAVLDGFAQSSGKDSQSTNAVADNLAPPSVAPIKWKDREPGETPPDFIRRAYGPWLEGGLSKRVLRGLDSTLVMELNKWVRDGNEMPADIKILTLKEENDLILANGDAGLRQHLGKFTGAEALREASRLRGAMERRK